MNFKDLEKDLKSKNFAPVYLFSGTEDFLAQDYINKIIKEVISPELEPLNVNKYSSKDFEINDVIANSETFPILSQKRIVVLENEANLFNLKDDRDIDSFIGYLNNPSDSTIVLIETSKPDKRKKLYKTLAKKAKIIEFNKLNLNDLKTWLNNNIPDLKNKLSPRDLDYFIDRTHYLESDNIDTATVFNELNRCLDYIGDGQLSRDIIDEIIPESLEDNIFKIIDSVVNGNLKDIYTILDSFWDAGESPIRILGLLIYQLRNLLKVKILLEENWSQKEIASRSKISFYVLKKLIPLARKFSLNRLYELYKEAADLDQKMKKGMIDHIFGLEYFLLKFNIKK